MNIIEAKQEIKNAITAYFTKDELGNYIIPLEKQRPVFLMGPPGIGKTAIMEQIASEMQVGLLSYSMTHHTRQSALGLPFIVHKNFDGIECEVSEYTMSEIIASVYDLIEKSGVKEGILFLDEINCVSETLAPIMLQFLQYKVFGKHKVPKGWIVVTAGNPPEYNNSVREFDIVTWDRLKRIDLEPDFESWKEYAFKSKIHASVISYLEIKQNDFYKIESTVDGKRFITARGWEDLSQMINLYEHHNIPVTENMVGQYIQNVKIAKSFTSYYELFNKYRSDYQIESIINGQASQEIITRATLAPFDEKLMVMSLILEAINKDFRNVIDEEKIIVELNNELKLFRKATMLEDETVEEVMRKIITKKEEDLKSGFEAGFISNDTKICSQKVINLLQIYINEVKETEQELAFKSYKKKVDAKKKLLKKKVGLVGEKLSNAFQFCEVAFNEGQELLIFVTELTANFYSAKFISQYGCEEYFKHNKELLFYERQREIIGQLEELNL